jgi:hypothetical protein
VRPLQGTDLARCPIRLASSFAEGAKAHGFAALARGEGWSGLPQIIGSQALLSRRNGANSPAPSTLPPPIWF